MKWRDELRIVELDQVFQMCLVLENGDVDMVVVPCVDGTATKGTSHGRADFNDAIRGHGDVIPARRLLAHGVRDVHAHANHARTVRPMPWQLEHVPIVAPALEEALYTVVAGRGHLANCLDAVLWVHIRRRGIIVAPARRVPLCDLA